MRLTLQLKPHVAESLDRVVRAEWNEEPDDWLRSAVLVNPMLARARQLRDGDVGAQQTQGDDIESVRRERDALRGALEAERAVRKRDRERQAGSHAGVRNARAAMARLSQSRAGYRNLALRVEAALLDAPPRADFRGIETRLRQALAASGFRMPAADPPTSPGSGPTPRRNAPARDTS